MIRNFIVADSKCGHTLLCSGVPKEHYRSKIITAWKLLQFNTTFPQKEIFLILVLPRILDTLNCLFTSPSLLPPVIMFSCKWNIQENKHTAIKLSILYIYNLNNYLVILPCTLLWLSQWDMLSCKQLIPINQLQKSICRGTNMPLWWIPLDDLNTCEKAFPDWPTKP